MSWLSLATKVIPLLWKAGAKATSALFSKGKDVVSATTSMAIQGTKQGLSFAQKNPKVTAVAAAATYAGWNNIGTSDSLGTSVGKSLRDVTDGAGGFAHDVVNGYTGENTVEQVKETTQSVVNGVTDSANATKDVLGGIGNMMSGLVNMIGSGIGAISNMFNNVGLGKISGLGIFGLIAAGYMMFGRSGILGKIGGALMAMFILNSTTEAKQKEQAATQTMQQGNTQENQQQSAMRR